MSIIALVGFDLIHGAMLLTETKEAGTVLSGERDT